MRQSGYRALLARNPGCLDVCPRLCEKNRKIIDAKSKCRTTSQTNRPPEPMVPSYVTSAHLCTDTTTTCPAKSINTAHPWPSGLALFAGCAVHKFDAVRQWKWDTARRFRQVMCLHYTENGPSDSLKTNAYFTPFRRTPAVWSRVRWTLRSRFPCLTTTGTVIGNKGPHRVHAPFNDPVCRQYCGFIFPSRANSGDVRRSTRT